MFIIAVKCRNTFLKNIYIIVVKEKGDLSRSTPSIWDDNEGEYTIEIKFKGSHSSQDKNRTWGEYTMFERYRHVFAEMVWGMWSQFLWRIGWKHGICLTLVWMVTLCWFKIYSLFVGIWNVLCHYCWDDVVEYWIFTVFEKYLVLK